MRARGDSGLDLFPRLLSLVGGIKIKHFHFGLGGRGWAGFSNVRQCRAVFHQCGSALTGDMAVAIFYESQVPENERRIMKTTHDVWTKESGWGFQENGSARWDETDLVLVFGAASWQATAANDQLTTLGSVHKEAFSG